MHARRTVTRRVVNSAATHAITLGVSSFGLRGETRRAACREINLSIGKEPGREARGCRVSVLWGGPYRVHRAAMVLPAGATRDRVRRPLLLVEPVKLVLQGLDPGGEAGPVCEMSAGLPGPQGAEAGDGPIDVGLDLDRRPGGDRRWGGAGSATDVLLLRDAVRLRIPDPCCATRDHEGAGAAIRVPLVMITRASWPSGSTALTPTRPVASSSCTWSGRSVTLRQTYPGSWGRCWRVRR